MDVGFDMMSLELTGSTEKIDDFIALLQAYGIVEVARSGVVSLERSRKAPILQGTGDIEPPRAKCKDRRKEKEPTGARGGQLFR